jgi:hypothetical protein
MHPTHGVAAIPAVEISEIRNFQSATKIVEIVASL